MTNQTIFTGGNVAYGAAYTMSSPTEEDHTADNNENTLCGEQAKQKYEISYCERE